VSLLGFDIGGTKCAVVVGTPSADVLARREFSSMAERGPEPMIAQLLAVARDLLSKFPCDAAGVAVGGPLDADRGVILSPPNLDGWDAVPLRERLSRELSMPVHMEHDAAACAMAEWRWGAGQGSSRLAYLTCATGFGVGFAIDGKPYYGTGGRSMEIGHIRYRDDGPVAFGKAGSFEAFGAASALSRLATSIDPERWGREAPSPETVARLAMNGDGAARQVMQLNAEAVGDACALLADLLVPDKILLGSLARYLGEKWTGAVRQRFAAQVAGGPGELTRVEPAGLGERLQDLSAIAAAMACTGGPV
jgi:glucokinase